MTEHRQALCPECGTVVPTDAPGGLCPSCVMAMNLAPDTVVPEEGGPGNEGLESAPSLSQIAGEFPQLEILGLLGRGGMGVVYKARQKRLNRLVALKLLAPERTNDPRFAQRFEREAKALAVLSHPNIVAVYDFGQAGGMYYLLMELVDGPNLREAMQTARFTPEQALMIVPRICEALHYAHENGVVHRDIKPENLLLDGTGRVKMADFGIARMLESGSADSRFTEFPDAGTPAYMAPEQAHGSHADQRSDIYSLGVVCYELLTGELPVQPVVPPSQKVPIDVRLDKVVLRALQRNPERRYQDAIEFQTCLEKIARRLPQRRARGALFAISVFILTSGSLVLCGLLCGSDGMGERGAPWAEIERTFRESYELQFANGYQTKRKELDQQYIQALERELRAATEGNRLEEAIAIRSEIERIKKQESFRGGEAQASGASLRRLREVYLQQVATIVEERDRAAAPLIANYERALEGLQAELTTSGKLDQALQVKQYREGNITSKVIPGFGEAGPAIELASAGGRPGEAEPLRAARAGVFPIDVSLPPRLRVPIGAGALPVELGRGPVAGFPGDGFAGEIIIPSGYRDREPHGLIIEVLNTTGLPPMPSGRESFYGDRKLIYIRAVSGVEFNQPGAEESAIQTSRALRQWAMRNYHIDAERCYLFANQRSVLRQVGQYADEFGGVIQYGYRYNAVRAAAGGGVERDRKVLPDASVALLRAAEFRMAYVAGGPNTKGVAAPEIVQETQALEADGLRILYIPISGYSPEHDKKAIEFIDGDS